MIITTTGVNVVILAAGLGFTPENYIAIFVALAGLMGGTIVAKINKKGNNENLLIDQLQEQNTSQEKRIQRLEDIVRDLDDYNQVLRLHISEGKAPPVPPYPVSLRNRQ